MLETAALESVSLAELDAVAALQTRTDRKYVVSRNMAARLVRGLGGSARVLEIDGMRTFRYESVYFDTPDLRMYLEAARGRPRRVKVRTRTYLDSGLCMLEVKTRDRRGLTVKHRLPHPVAESSWLNGEALAFVGGFGELADLGAVLRPTLTTMFDRTTLLLGAGEARITVDTDLRMVAPDGAVAAMPFSTVIETKSPGAPTLADRVLWAAHHRPDRVSKYGTGLAALRSDLPSNRWHRLIRNHVARA